MNEFDRIYGELNGTAAGGSETPEVNPEGTPESTLPGVETPAAEAAPVEEPAPAPEEAPAAYKWDYGEQNRADIESAEKNKKSSGVRAYALIMTAVFAAAFGLLLGVLLMTGKNGCGSSRGTYVSGDVLSDMDIHENLETVKQSVVLIQVTTKTGGGTGSGVVLNEKGYIATNHHVIENAEKVLVTFLNGDKAYAEVIGSSAMDDLAVIRVDTSDLSERLSPATFGEYEDVFVGQTVFAVGAPAGEEFCWTVTGGIVSYKNREVRKYNEDGTMSKKLRTLQTDANVNPGNSGGPLVDVYGRVVGIVSMKLVGDYEGMGFAIPSDGAQEILDAIIRDGNADSVNSSLSFKRPVLGIVGVYMEKGHTYIMDDAEGRIIDVTEGLSEYTFDDVWNELVASGGKPVGPIEPGASGIYVCSVTEGTGSYGVLEEGDVIMSVNNIEATSMDALMNELNKHYVGDSVTLEVFRDGRNHVVTMVLSASKE